MNVALVRLGKETRALIGPWSAVTLVAVALLSVHRLDRAFHHTFSWDWLLLARFAGFWIGLPLLATLSIGHEFQHGTAPLLLAQPINRGRIWTEKWIVLLPALVTAGFLYLWSDLGLGLPLKAFYLDAETRALAILWMVLVTGTAPYWTLVGRSTLNGLVLNLIQGFVIFQIWQWVDSVLDPGHVFHQELFYLGVVAASLYAVVMFWLGHRKFVRFEVDGGSTSADVLLPAFRGTGGFASLLRSQAGQPLLNLVRKEMRLLWVVWLLMSASMLGTLCVAALQFAPGYSLNHVSLLVGGFVLAVSSLSAILAGSLSVGEERTAGTQAWHRTLPISGAKQWLVKLGVVLSVSFVAALLPVLVAKFTVGLNLGVPFGFSVFSNNHEVLSLFVFSSLLSFSAFWCACLVKGTIRAALLAIPVMAFVLAALELGMMFVRGLHFSPMLDPLVLRFHPFPFPGDQGFGYFGDVMDWLIVPPFLLALGQTYRLFRREAHQRFFDAFRLLLEVALTALVFSMALGIPSAVVTRAGQRSYFAIGEASDAIAMLPLEMIPKGPTQLSAEDLFKAYPFTEGSRIVLRGAVISTNRSAGFRFGSNVTAIRFRNGLSCTVDGGYRCEMQTGK